MRYITGAGSFMLYSFLRAFALFSDPTKLHGVVPSVDLAGNADAEAAQILSAYARAVSVLLFASGLVAGYGGNKGRSVCTGRSVHTGRRRSQESNPSTLQPFNYSSKCWAVRAYPGYGAVT